MFWHARVPRTILFAIVILCLVMALQYLRSSEHPILIETSELRELVHRDQWQEAEKKVEDLLRVFKDHQGTFELFGPTKEVHAAKKNILVLEEAIRLNHKGDSLLLLVEIEQSLQEFVIL